MKKEGFEEPLLGKDKDVNERRYNICTSICTVLKLSYMPILGFLFHPMYQLINAIFVGRMNDKVYLAGLGLGSLTTGILLLATGINFSITTNTVIA